MKEERDRDTQMQILVYTIKSMSMCYLLTFFDKLTNTNKVSYLMNGSSIKRDISVSYLWWIKIWFQLQYCILTAGAAPHSNNLDKKKRVGSKPVPPVLDSVPASKVGAIYVSGAPSPISNHSNDKKVEPKTDDHNTSIPISGQINIADVTVLLHFSS